MKETLNKDTFSDNVSELKTYQSKKLAKYRRNFRRYNFTPYATIENIKNPSEVGWYQANPEIVHEEDLLQYPEMNVIKSTIDALTSKIAESKVRPFFNCINGSFKDILIVKQAQQFFDQLYDWQDVNKKVSETFRDCGIFDTGCIYIDEENINISRALPWQVFYRPAEKTYDKLTRIYYERKHFPVSLLPERITSKLKNKLREYEYITYGIYYDIFYHKKCVYIPELDYFEEKLYEASVLPFVFLFYNSPIMGDSSESIVDMLNSIQLEVDQLMARISDASQVNPANTYFLPEGSSIKASQLNNRVGNVVSYRPSPNMTGTPVTVATPPFISEQYMNTVKELKQTAYEMVGISQLSAMSLKPTGLNSGIALQSMENIESDRFETQLNQVVRAYVDIAKICIQVFPKEADILPPDRIRRTIKWADIVEETNKLIIQYSGADSLSKDPSTKLQQLQTLATAGIIPVSRISQFLEIPDLQSGYSMSNNAINAVMTIIENCLEKDVFDVPEYIPFGMLKEEIINTQLSLASANFEGNQKDIEKLNELFAITEDKEQNWNDDINKINQAANNMQMVNAGEDQQLPQQTNVLSQEAQMQPSDLDVEADGAQPGEWNAG